MLVFSTRFIFWTHCGIYKLSAPLIFFNRKDALLCNEFSTSSNNNTDKTVISENLFIKNGSSKEISIGEFNLTAYPVKSGDSYSCDYPAEIQLQNYHADHTNDGSYGLIISPAMWQGYSNFSPNQTSISNPDECSFDKVPDNSDRQLVFCHYW